MPSRVDSKLKLGNEVRIRRVDFWLWNIAVASVNVGCVCVLLSRTLTTRI